MGQRSDTILDAATSVHASGVVTGSRTTCRHHSIVSHISTRILATPSIFAKEHALLHLRPKSSHWGGLHCWLPSGPPSYGRKDCSGILKLGVKKALSTSITFTFSLQCWALKETFARSVVGRLHHLDGPVVLKGFLSAHLEPLNPPLQVGPRTHLLFSTRCHTYAACALPLRCRFQLVLCCIALQCAGPVELSMHVVRLMRRTTITATTGPSGLATVGAAPRKRAAHGYVHQLRMCSQALAFLPAVHMAGASAYRRCFKSLLCFGLASAAVTRLHAPVYGLGEPTVQSPPFLQ